MKKNKQNNSFHVYISNLRRLFLKYDFSSRRVDNSKMFQHFWIIFLNSLKYYSLYVASFVESFNNNIFMNNLKA